MSVVETGGSGGAMNRALDGPSSSGGDAKNGSSVTHAYDFHRRRGGHFENTDGAYMLPRPLAGRIQYNNI